MKRVLFALLGMSLLVACDNNNNEGAGDQQPQQVDFVAQKIGGEYCGQIYDTIYYNYYICFTDNGFDEAGEYLPNSNYYYLDCYSAEPFSDRKHIQLPVGAYSFDGESTYNAGTFSASYSKLVKIDATGKYKPAENDHYFKSGLLFVREDGTLEASLVTEDGTVHNLTYSGDYTLPAVPGSGADGPYTTFTQDTELSFAGAEGMADYYGDYFVMGHDHWVVMLVPKNRTGNALQLTLMGSGKTIEDGYDGEYTCSRYGDAMTFYPGVYDYGDLMDSWFVEMLNGGLGSQMAPLQGGTITITSNNDGTTTIDIDCTDDGYPTANRITGSWTGTMTVENRARPIASCGTTISQQRPHTAAMRRDSKVSQRAFLQK